MQLGCNYCATKCGKTCLFNSGITLEVSFDVVFL